ncbi:unnamed protein product [Pleuronectes platessa]|uniref:Uncharacterized protein n=1 Tax=Pleuronectes platessa TaxID=8262 RepID=A0A9N7VH67_PLEPL|nr:unnamed protein product [Pleuronectes platessa]
MFACLLEDIATAPSTPPCFSRHGMPGSSAPPQCISVEEAKSTLFIKVECPQREGKTTVLVRMENEGVLLLCFCQLAPSPWQWAGVRVPVRLPPPVWSLEESQGSCEGGAPRWGGMAVCACVSFVLRVHDMWGFEDRRPGGSGVNVGDLDIKISATGRGGVITLLVVSAHDSHLYYRQCETFTLYQPSESSFRCWSAVVLSAHQGATLRLARRMRGAIRHPSPRSVCFPFITVISALLLIISPTQTDSDQKVCSHSDPAQLHHGYGRTL